MEDINNVGQIVGNRADGGSLWDGPFLYESGNFFQIELPPDFEFPQVFGINDMGEIVGTYQRKEVVDGIMIYRTHGFRATREKRSNWERDSDPSREEKLALDRR